MISTQGWESKAGDTFFKNRRHQADNADQKSFTYMNNMMRRIAEEMQQATGAFSILNAFTEQPMILDMCTAPGIYLQYALEANPGAGALGFSLPYDQGGHRLVVETGGAVRVRLLDVTMLAADMGVPAADIPPGHPHARDFGPAELPAGQLFHLVLCDGQVLRNHEAHRAAYREGREASRLLLTQLALGLEHLRPGGTMIVLLHLLDAWDTIVLLHTFTKFSSVRLFKPRRGHATRSSFYMVAQCVQSQQAEAIAAVRQWKEDWRIATFETDEQRWRELRRQIGADIPDVDAFLQDFGPKLVKMGRELWAVQADALERAPFMSRG